MILKRNEEMGRSNSMLKLFEKLYGIIPGIKKGPLSFMEAKAMTDKYKDDLIVSGIKPILMRCPRCGLYQYEEVDKCKRCGEPLEGWSNGKDASFEN